MRHLDQEIEIGKGTLRRIVVQRFRDSYRTSYVGTFLLTLESSLAIRRNPLLWALPVQALLLFWNLDLLDPWGDEWFTLTTVPLPLHNVLSTVAGNIHPPLYYLLLHYWIQLPFPASLNASMRAMSALWTLLATVTVYALWLRREDSRFQRMFLALWVLSPCLLLHGRMARSYSMQLAIAPVAIYAALRWAEQPRDYKRLAACTAASGALLYTHYLSGIAIAASIGLLLIYKRKIVPALSYAALVAVLYLPWIPVLIGALGKWRSAEAAPEGNLFVDQLVRLGYLFVSFSFGETHSTLSLLLAVLLTPFVVYALWRGLRSRPPWEPLLLCALALGWIGVTRWAQFPFMTTGLLFALPFFLMLLVPRLTPVTFAAMLVLYLSADAAYFQRTGFLIKTYAAPFREMAEVIRSGSAGQPALLAIDPYGAFYAPMLARLPANVRVITLDDESSADAVRAALRNRASGPQVVWLWRHTRDVSPGAFTSKLEADLTAAGPVHRYDFEPYSAPERWIRRLLRGPGQAEYYYRLVEAR